MSLLEAAIAEKKRRRILAAAIAERDRRAGVATIDFTQEPLLDLSQEEPARQFIPAPQAAADPTSIGPQPTIPEITPLTRGQKLAQFQDPDIAGTELSSEDFIAPAGLPTATRLGPARKFQGVADEFIRALGRGALNVGSGLLSSFADVAVDSLFDAEKIQELSDSAREAAQDPAFQPGTDGKIKGFIANAVGDALPFMTATIAATLVGGPQAGFGVAYSVEGKNAYFDALEAGATQAQAEMEGMIVGSINAAIELMQIGKIKKFAKAGKQSVKEVAKAAKNNAVKTLLKQGKNITKEGVELAITEGLQEATQETVSVLAPLTTGRELPGETLKEKALIGGKRVLQAGAGGFVAGPILGGAGRISVAAANRFGIEVDEEGTPVQPEAARFEAEVSATLAGLQAQSEAEAKLAAGTPLSEAERTQFPQIAEQEAQIAKLAETPKKEAKAAPAKVEKPSVKSFSEQVEDLKALQAKGEITTAELGKRIAEIDVAGPVAKPAAVKADGIQAILDREQDGEIEFTDAVDEIEGVTEDKAILKGIKDFRDAIEEDIQEFGGRSGLENEAEDRLRAILAKPVPPTQAPVVKPAVAVQPEGVEEAKAVEAAAKPKSKAQQRNIDALKKFPDAQVVKGTTRVRMESPKGVVFQIPATQIQGKLDAGFTLLTKPKKPVTVTKPPKKVEPKPVTAEVKQTQSKAVQGEPVTQQTVKEVEDAIKVDVTDPAFPTSTKHASTKEIRDRLGIGQVNSKTRRSDEQAMAEAVERKIPEKALRIADDINTTARALSDIEDAGMRIKVAELEIEHEQLSNLIGKVTDDADIKTLGAEIGRVRAEFDAIQSALETSGTEAGRALRARKVQISRDFKLISVLNQAKAAAGKKLTAIQERLFKQLTEKLSKTVKQVDALRIEVAILKAGQTVKRGARRFTTMNKQQRQTSRQGLSAKVVELLQQGCAN